MENFGEIASYTQSILTLHATKILKSHSAFFTHLLTDFNIRKSFLYILDFKIWKVIFIFYLSFRMVIS